MKKQIFCLIIVLSAVSVSAIASQAAVATTPEPLQQESGTPTAEFRTSPVQPAPFEQVRFDASPSVVPADGYTRYQWEYETTRGVQRASGETFTHTFQSAQTFEVQLTVTDSQGNSDTVVRSVTPRADPPTADFTVNPSEPGLNERIVFDASASEAPDVEIVDYRWFINGEPESTDRRLTKTFSTSELYTVELRVEDRAGQTDRYSQTFEIGDRAEIYDNPEFELDRISPERKVGVSPDERTSFTAEITSDEVPQATYRFYIGDTVITQQEVEINSLRETYQFEQRGEYTVQMEVEGEAGQSDVVEWDVTSSNFNALPTVSQQSSNQRMEVGGSTEIITFSVQNPDENEKSLSTEIVTKLPDGMSISGARDVTSGDAAIQTARTTVSPGRQESMRLEINVNDESLEGTQISIPYQVRWGPIGNDTIGYAANADSLGVTVEQTDPEPTVSDPDSDPNDDSSNSERSDNTSDESPGFAVSISIIGILLSVLILRQK
jgi:PKD repeat protein